jgi:hypothetical protein
MNALLSDSVLYGLAGFSGGLFAAPPAGIVLTRLPLFVSSDAVPRPSHSPRGLGEGKILIALRNARRRRVIWVTILHGVVVSLPI